MRALSLFIQILSLFIKPIIAERGDPLLLFRDNKERFHIPSQEIQIQLPDPLGKAAEKFRMIQSENPFDIDEVGNGKSHQERNIIDIPPLFPFSRHDGHHLLCQEYACRRHQDLPVNNEPIQKNLLRFIQLLRCLSVDADEYLPNSAFREFRKL